MAVSFILQAQVSVRRIEKFLTEKETSRDDQLIGIQDVVDIGDRGNIQPAENPPTQDFPLLGEMELLRGRVYLPLAEQPIGDDTLISDAAYCPQEPWIMNHNIRAKILFGLQFQSHRYKMVIDDVALSRDLAGVENGDLAIAGERGSRLSGGQEQRAALARALYSHAQFLLLDDCLSALDSRSGRHILLHAVKGPLMERRTCILATHSQFVLPHCDYAVFLQNGIVNRQGTTSELLESDGPKLIDFTHHLKMIASPLLPSGASETEPPDNWTENTSTASEIQDELIYHKDQMTGAEQTSGLRYGLMGFMRQWKLSAMSHGYPAHVKSGYYFAVYGLICLAYVIISFIRYLTTFSGALKAPGQLFDSLLESILHARLMFFDKLPFGQIKKLEVAPHSMSTVYTLCSLSTVIILISIMIPLFIPAAVIICLVYYNITVIYINNVRDLKRMESAQRSPLYQHFGEALTGYVSVRAYGHMNRFTEENQAAKQWLTSRIAFLSALISWLTGTFLLWGLGRGTVDAGIAGIVLTYAVTFSDNVLWFVQLYAILQQSFNSAERIVEYTDIKREPSESLEPPSYDLSPQWPIHGHVRFQAYTARRDTGSITIDGVSIASVNLVRLRRAVTVVPQDPTVFGGSLHDNLDPLRHYSDDDLHDILRRLQFFQYLPSGDLGHPAAALSIATASIDHATDALIQVGLRSEHGSVAELLQKRGDGAFFQQLCEQSGDLAHIERIVRGL
ncbi:P-loop containing nucleoside triphosphate hydrolase protein [Trichoderma pleuroticola]